MDRAEMLARVEKREESWDIIVIGGGASGVGCAVDAASRGYSVLLLEQSDFGKGTSSRSTKLVHGGVRYLEQGNVSLVTEALRERGILRRNAAHAVKNLPFVVPNYDWWEMPFYGVGLKIYDLLAAKYRFGKSKILSKKEILKRLPTIKTEGLRGGVIYFDGQFDDARLLIDLTATAVRQGAIVLNYARVFGLNKNAAGKIDGVNFIDEESGQIFAAKAKIVINATGAFCDALRKMSDAKAENIIAPSRGIHLVFDRSFLPTDHAIMIPHTADGRVLFAIPWHDRTLVGTTDTAIEKAELEPRASDEEIDFILTTAAKYLCKPPRREDVLSVFAGVRPLVKSSKTTNTSTLSRDHTIELNEANLLTLTGGKWTTYRLMAEDAVNRAAATANLPAKKCVTKTLKINDSSQEKIDGDESEMNSKIHPDLPYTIADIVRAARFETARTVEDVLTRRTRALFLDARPAVESAPKIAEILARELGFDEAWQREQIAEFEKTAQNYIL